jgi:hypothetical protein
MSSSSATAPGATVPSVIEVAPQRNELALGCREHWPQIVPLDARAAGPGTDA